jgi:hypothetical protein
MYIILLLSPPPNGSQKMKEEYWKWVEDKFLDPIKEQDLGLYSFIVDWYKGEIAELSNLDLAKLGEEM